MLKRIEGTIYRLRYNTHEYDFVECSNTEDLFHYIAEEIIKGKTVYRVEEMRKDGKDSHIPLRKNDEFRRILRQHQNPKTVYIGSKHFTNGILAVKESDIENEIMTRDEMIKLIKMNPYVKITHRYFGSNEYIYSRASGGVYTEDEYLFEDWHSEEFNGIRMREGDGWDIGWSLYKGE